MRIYRINEFVSELETDLLANQVQNAQDNTCIIDPKTGECPNVAYPAAGTVGEYFGTLQQSVVEAWRSHLKTSKYSDHKALDEFYKDMPEKVDALVEAYMGKYGKVEDEYRNVMWENMEISVYLEMLLVFVQNGAELFFNKEKDSELLSLVDDIKKQIESALYQLKELNEMFNIPWAMADEIGYEPKTTFWQDFSIADRFGAKAVKDTYKRAFEEWKDNYEYLTELVLVLNHKIWEHYNRDEMTLAKLYDELWRETDEYAVDNLKGDELSYYYKTTD
jgi:hypothetical protein